MTELERTTLIEKCKELSDKQLSHLINYSKQAYEHEVKHLSDKDATIDMCKYRLHQAELQLEFLEIYRNEVASR